MREPDVDESTRTPNADRRRMRWVYLMVGALLFAPALIAYIVRSSLKGGVTQPTGGGERSRGTSVKERILCREDNFFG